MIAQLQNQDPENPTDGTTFVTQLATFTNVQEQTQSTNDLGSILSLMAGASPSASARAAHPAHMVSATAGTAAPAGTAKATPRRKWFFSNGNLDLTFFQKGEHMLTAFSTALSALSADTTAIDVVGNNLANLNTTGFKDSTVSFNDLVTQAIGAVTGSSQVGVGVGAPITTTQFTQGAITSTGGPLDAAIQGSGFFVITTPAGAAEYTRAGNFQVDSSGNLTTATGELVQGWTVSGGVLNTSGPIGPITVPAGALAKPETTHNTSVSLNLDAAAACGNPRFLDVRSNLRFARNGPHRYVYVHPVGDAQSVELFGRHSSRRHHARGNSHHDRNAHFSTPDWAAHPTCPPRTPSR